MAFLGDALAHGILPGIAVAYLDGSLVVGALVAAVVVALGVGCCRAKAPCARTPHRHPLAAALSLGVVLISSIRSYAVDLNHICSRCALGGSLGSLVTAGWAWWCCWPCCSCFELSGYSFDPVFASTLGVRTEVLRMTLLVMLA